MHIRRLIPSDAAAFQELRLEALRECPLAFSSSYVEECEIPLIVIESQLTPGSGRNMFGAFTESQLVGVVGVGRESAIKLRHKGFIRGMYVRPADRYMGIGRRLLIHALEFAGSMEGLRQVTLAVTASNAAAIALYESMGFNAIGHEPDALQVDGVMYDEVQMVRRIETATQFADELGFLPVVLEQQIVPGTFERACRENILFTQSKRYCLVHNIEKLAHHGYGH